MNKVAVFFKSLLEDKSKLVFCVLSLFFLVYIVVGSFNAGISGDETLHMDHAENVYKFYKTFGRDTTASIVTPNNSMAIYGQVVDNLAFALSEILGIEDGMQVRHTTTAIFGWIAMLFAALIAFRLGGRKYLPAIFTLVLFCFSPRFLGHSFNNPKDASLATAMCMGIYYMIIFLQNFPKVKKSTVIMLIVSIGFAIAIRVGGLLLVAYLGLFCLLFFIKQYSIKGIFNQPNSKLFWRMFKYGVIIVLGGYILAVLLWPYALVAPIGNVVDTFKLMSHYTVSIRQLFESSLIMSSNLPWYYTPKYIYMTIPIAVIIGALIYLFTGWGKENRFWTFLLLFCFVFPVFWIAYTAANVYGGWRHSIFVYPTLVILAGLGFNSLVNIISPKFKNKNIAYKITKVGLIALPFLLLFNPIKHVIKNHPYEYVYFNEFTGGIENMIGNYEMDYYYHSTREAAEWIMANADTASLKEGEKINVISFHLASVDYCFRNHKDHFKCTFSRIYDMGDRDWDYGIFTVTGMNPEWLKNPKTFPPINTVYTIEVDDTPICIVLKRTDKSDFYGFQAQKRNQIDSAIMYFKEALESNPYNEQALDHLAGIYTNQGKFDSAEVLALRWYEAVPTNTGAAGLLANVYFSKGDYAKVINVASQLKKVPSGEVYGYWLAANAYVRQQQLQLALNELQTLLKKDEYFKNAYLLMAQIYQTTGQTAAAQQCQNIAAQLR